MRSSMKCALIVCFAVAVLLKSSHGLNNTGCGTSKSCYMMPAGCSPSSSSCLFVSYTYNPTSQEFTFELSGGSGAGTQYAAMAFTSGAEMMNGDLYYCIGSELKSGSLGTRYALPTTTPALPTGVTSISANTANGVGECTFTRPASITKT
uniref:DOMON domain-containing protein n=1 Tax=Ciona savignyi TaxID=51511 RepID=H2YQJ8_CIOSA